MVPGIAPELAETPALAEHARRELGIFLRSRRERIAPQDVGLPGGGRRRTPGLRREEVAVLAGVGVTWYAWLEQGRAIGVSRHVLEAVMTALRFEPDEREHVWRLASATSASSARDADADRRNALRAVVTDEYLRLLTALGPVPACIQTAKFDVLASNASYRFLVGDIDDGPVEDRNCMVKLFLDRDSQRAYDNYETFAASMVARFRAAMPEHLDDPAWLALAERLRSASSLFSGMWDQHELSSTGIVRQKLHLRSVGTVTVLLTRLRIETASGAHLVAFQPDTDADADRLAQLAQTLTEYPTVTDRLDAPTPQDRQTYLDPPISSHPAGRHQPC